MIDSWPSMRPAAIARVFDHAAPKLLLLAAHWTNNAADREDLVQATFVQAVRDAEQFDPGRRVLPWLAKILANLQ